MKLCKGLRCTAFLEVVGPDLCAACATQRMWALRMWERWWTIRQAGLQWASQRAQVRQGDADADEFASMQEYATRRKP